jgi:hypothetical protein
VRMISRPCGRRARSGQRDEQIADSQAWASVKARSGAATKLATKDGWSIVHFSDPLCSDWSDQRT